MLPGLHAQHSITGKISDSNSGESLPGAHITLGGTFLTTISTANGQYVLKNVKTGIYTLKVSYVGYETASRELTIENNVSLDIDLRPAAVMQDEVVIRGIRTFDKEAPSFSNISEQQVEKENLGRDMPYLMTMTPSAVATSDAGNGVGYTAIRIRGTDITGINVTLNGIPLNDPESHGVWWVNMPDLASSVNKMQVQRGVGTSTDGAGAFGANINILTNQYSANPYAEINSSYGSYNTIKGTLRFGSGLLKGRWSFDGRASYLASDGYIDRASSNLRSFAMSAAYSGEKSIYRFNIFSGKEKTYQAWEGVPKDSLETNRTYNPYTYDNETDNYLQDHYQFFYAREINKAWHLNAAIFYVRGRGYYEQYKKDRSFYEYGLDDPIIGVDTITHTDLVQQKWLDNHFYGLTANLDYKIKKIDLTFGGGYNYYNGDHFGKVIWAEYSVNIPKDYQWYLNNGLKKEGNIYAKARYYPFEKLNIYGDLQYRMISYTIDGTHDNLADISQEHDFRFFNPKLGLIYEPGDHHSIYFTFGIANREPNRSAYRDAIPGENPTYETLYDYEVGYKYTLSMFSLSANLFYMDYNDQLVLTGKINNVGDPVFTNVKDSYRTGIEILAGIKPFSRLSWDMNATFSRNRIKDFTAYVDNWNYWDDPENQPYQYEKYLGETEISFSPSVTAGSIIDYEAIKDLHIALISNYVGRQYIDNTSSEDRSLDPYFVNNLRLIYTLRTHIIREISFHFQVNNIFNEEYESNAWVYRYIYNGVEGELNGYFPQAPINYFVGVAMKF